MLEFLPLKPEDKPEIDRYLLHCGSRGCEYSFANLFMWGRQRATFYKGFLVLFSQFNRRSVYPYPIGRGDRKAALDAIMEDAARRGIPCRISGLLEEDCRELERLYPGQFRIHSDRDGFDYVYAIDDLADLKGRAYQKKRNHVNRFFASYPDAQLVPMSRENLAQVEEMCEKWFENRYAVEPNSDFHMEKCALNRAWGNWEALGMEGMTLFVDGQLIAFAMGSRLSIDTFDIHFEKALDVDGAYAAINRGFARYLADKYPEVKYLNREDDLGIEGLRKAKLSYLPHHMVEKSWACLLEDGNDY